MTGKAYLSKPADCQKSPREEVWFAFRMSEQKMERMERPSILYFFPQHTQSSASNFLPNVSMNIIC